MSMDGGSNSKGDGGKGGAPAPATDGLVLVKDHGKHHPYPGAFEVAFSNEFSKLTVSTGTFGIWNRRVLQKFGNRNSTPIIFEFQKSIFRTIIFKFAKSVFRPKKVYFRPQKFLSKHHIKAFSKNDYFS